MLFIGASASHAPAHEHNHVQWGHYCFETNKIVLFNGKNKKQDFTV